MVPDASRAEPSSSLPREGTTLPAWLSGQASVSALTVGFLIVAVAAAGALFLPGRVFSREMTWDLLFNLEGAWHLANGHTPYVDFHDPLGVLGFALTRLGFLLVGPRPVAFLVGECVALAVLGAAAIGATARRLPLVPGLIVMTTLALLVLLPANVGDPPQAYSFAMSYNRLGWALLLVLTVVLFLPPAAGRESPAADLLLAGALCVAAFYVKVTYAAGALGAVAVAPWVAPHLAPHRRFWALLALALVAFAALPPHHAYLHDAWVIGGSRARTDLYYLVNTMVANRAEYTVLALAVGVLAWLWLAGHATAAPMLAATVVSALGAAVLTQNAQDADIPLGLVVWLVVYQTLAAVTARMRHRERAVLLALALLWPLVSIGSAVKVFAGYVRAATAHDVVVAGAGTQIEGLAVAPRIVDGPDTGAEGAATQVAYLQSLLAAARALEGPPARVLILDQVNPLPFVLGYPPPRGGVLWLGPSAPDREATAVFQDVEVVLVPHRSSNPGVTRLALDAYGAYVAREFPDIETLPDWTLHRRARGVRGAVTAPPPR